jgi:hypothetical protein
MPFLRRCRTDGPRTQAPTTRRRARACRTLAAGALLAACDSTPTTQPETVPPPDLPSLGSYLGPQSVAGSFQLLGGYRLQVEYASEGLGLIRDADGYVVEAVAGAHAQSNALHLYDLRQAFGAGSDAAAYPVVAPKRTWSVPDLFPRMMSGQTIRDVAIIPTSTGYDLAGIGRVYYNTSPRATTQINVRTLSADGATMGAAREIAVNLPEQEFSGFIKSLTPSTDLQAIGAGAYDSGQGSVGGLSYAVQGGANTWTRRLTPPGFGDLTSPRLPRDANYSCDDPPSWVCLPPVNGQGVWSTERIGGGGVRYGDNVLFIPMLGGGARSYARQSYTFGDPAQDRAFAYFFKENAATGAVTFASYGRWVHAAPGEQVVGVALGRMRGVTGDLLFVAKSYAWETGRYKVGSVVQVFRVVP